MDLHLKFWITKWREIIVTYTCEVESVLLTLYSEIEEQNVQPLYFHLGSQILFISTYNKHEGYIFLILLSIPERHLLTLFHLLCTI